MATPRTTFYFHGTPGSEEELQLFGEKLCAGCADWTVVNRYYTGRSLDQEFDRLAGGIGVIARGRPVRLVGFSLGTHSALEIASRLKVDDVEIELISAAAPLQSGDFLPYMAGGTIFRLAQKNPRLFGMAARMQGLMARGFPSILVKALFAGAHPSDRTLLEDPVFRDTMQRNLALSLATNGLAYRREITAYMKDWRTVLAKVSCPVRLWHGAADNWSPPAMADALGAALPNAEPPNFLPDLSHYSTLKHAIAEIGAKQMPQGSSQT